MSNLRRLGIRVLGANLRRLGVLWVVAAGFLLAACEPDEFHPRDEEGEEAGPPVAPSEEARDAQRREAEPEGGAEP